MKSGRTLTALIVFIFTVILLSGCSTGKSATNYPVGMKQKRVFYTGTGNTKVPPVSLTKKRIAKSPPKNYVIPDSHKTPMYK